MIRRRQKPKPGQESVWDYPRPPRLEETEKQIVVIFQGVEIANTRGAKRILETSHPPVYYLPLEDIRMEFLRVCQGSSWCEWKGQARFFNLEVEGRVVARAAWSYPDPTAAFTAIQDHLAFYAGPMDGCYVDGEMVTPQPGEFYGGWITSDIAGPFKGEPGTMFW